jgi:CubicO group peptidase (beta-lactamase class C family)
MYSCSKPITAVCALRLVEKGLLSIDDKVYKYLPEVKEAFVLDENKNKKIVGESMTVRHLLTMTAGFDYNYFKKPIIDLIENNGNAVLRDFIERFVASPLCVEPGKKFIYSICHDVLAGVIEVASGMKFSEFVRSEIFEPLGMNNSSFDNSVETTFPMYGANEDGTVHRQEKYLKLNPTPTYESGGAGLVSTVEDYILFASALANNGVGHNGYRVLTEDSLNKLNTPQVKSINYNSDFTCVQGEDYDYGLGVRVRNSDTDWGLKAGEYGWDGAAGSYVMIDPTNNISIFMGMHVMTWPNVFSGNHLDIVEQIYTKILPNIE